MDPFELIDAELARCRGSLCDLADALTAQACPPARALRRRRVRSRAGAAAAAGVFLITGCGASAALAAWHQAPRARVTTAAHVRRRPACHSAAALALGACYDVDGDGDRDM